MRRAALFVCLSFAASLFAQDSPMVAAAKRTNRAKPKSKIVITNDTLSTSGGHISTTSAQAPVKPLPKEATKATTVTSTATTTAQPQAPKMKGAEGNVRPLPRPTDPQDTGIVHPYPNGELPPGRYTPETVFWEIPEEMKSTPESPKPADVKTTEKPPL